LSAYAHLHGVYDDKWYCIPFRFIF
jgi:hypothetical protein